MRHFYLLVLALAGAAALAFSSCVKAPELTLTGPASLEISADGGSGSITFTANREWSVRSSDSWVSVTPSSGSASDGTVTLSIRCFENTTYEDRTATVTITMEELSQTVTVKQPANLGIVIPTQSYNLASDARTIDVEVRSNVQYAVSVSDSWIKQTGTKGLVTDKLTFSIEENDTYDARSATITIKPQNATVQEQVISVKQAQKDALIVKDTSFDMPYGGGEIEVKVEANVSFDVKPSEDWIHYVETKALSGSTVRLTVDENATYSAREGKIEIKQKNGSLSHTLTVKQAGRIAVTSIELNKTSLTLKEGDTETLVATVKPDNATDKTVTWSSSNASVASVDEMGVVSALGEGEAEIKASAGSFNKTCSVVVSNNIVFQDARFKQYCVEHFDLNGDGELSKKEADTVEEIVCEFIYGISSMEDIVHFHNLKKLSLNALNLEELDVSSCALLQKLECISDQLSSLNICGCTALEELNCANNRLVTLDIGNQPLLQQLKCSDNQLSTIDLCNNALLLKLDCSGNQLSVLDLSNNTSLRDLNIASNQFVTFDFTSCAAIQVLNCARNQFTTLDVSPLTSLQELDCSNNLLASLDASSCTSLQKLYCSGNEYTSLDLGNYKSLKKIEYLGGPLNSLNVEGCSSLLDLECLGSQLTDLDVKSCSLLETLVCSNSKLTTLDVSGCTALRLLSCGGDQLTSLKAEGCSSLQEIRCTNNNLSNLDVSGCLSLLFLDCSRNQLTNLEVKDFSSLESLCCSGNQLENLDVRGCTSLSELNCSGNQLTYLNVNDCSVLTGLYCGSNQLQNLDVSNNLKLQSLHCRLNPFLTELWLKNGQSINDLMYDNSITSIMYKD